MQDRNQTGQCLCGAVRFSLAPPLRDVIVCHCRQCARWTGHAVAATAVPTDRFALLAGLGSLKWHRSSDHAERGFCAECGSSLFWRPASGSRISVLAGALDPPTGLKVGAHVFVECKSDYYEICDGVRCYPRSAGELADVPKKG